MKLNLVQSIVAMAISILISYALYSFHTGESKILLCIGNFVLLASTLITSIGASFEFPITTANVRVLSILFFLIALVSNLVFTFINFSIPSYVVTNGILLLIFFLIVYSISNAKQ